MMITRIPNNCSLSSNSIKHMYTLTVSTQNEAVLDRKNAYVDSPVKDDKTCNHEYL